MRLYRIDHDVWRLRGKREAVADDLSVPTEETQTFHFLEAKIGKWWGNNPCIKAEDDVDILMIDKTGKKGVFVECKFRNSKMPHKEYEDLKNAMLAFPHIEEKYMYFVSKSGYEDSVIRHAAEDGAILLGLENLFEN